MAGRQLRVKQGRVTMTRVAEEAGVSLGTVSRVVNNHARVQPELRARVKAAMERLGYVPDSLAQAMRTRQTNTIACMVPNIAVPFFSQSVAAAEGVLYEEGYTLLLSNTYEDAEREKELLSFFRQRRIDGLLAAISTDGDADLLRRIEEVGVPVVLLQRFLPIEVDAVAVDHFMGVTRAMEYLFDLGHRRVGVVIGRTGLPARERAEAFKRFNQAAGIPFDADLVHYCGLSQDLAYRSIQQLLELLDPPTAIIAGANQMVGVLHALRARRVAIPGEMSVVSLGETDLTRLYEPSITAVRWDNAAVGSTAAHLLLDRIRGNDSKLPAKEMIAAEIVLGRSCGPRQR